MTTNNSIDFFGIGRKSKIVKSQFGINNSKGIKANYNFMGGKPANKIDSRFIGNPLSLAPKQQNFSKIHQSYWGEKHSNVPIWMQRNTDNGKNLGGKKKKIKEIPPQGQRTKEILKTKKKVNKPEVINVVTNNTAVKTVKVKSKKNKKSLAERKEIAQEKTDIILRALQSKGKYASAEAAMIASLEKGKVPKTKYLKQIAETRRRQIIRLEPQELGIEKLALNKIRAKEKELYEKDKTKRIKELTKEGLSGEERKNILKEQRIQDKLQRQKTRSERVEDITEKTKDILTGKAALDLLKRARISHEAISERTVEAVKAVPKALRATYGKEERATTKKVQRLVKAGLGGIFGASITQQKFGPAIKGRPGGPSGKYMIEGKPVYEEEFQKYAAEQRAKNRILPSQNQQAPLTAEQQVQMYSDQTVDTNQNLPSTSRPMTPGEIQATKQMATPQRGYTSEEVKMAQQLAQQQDQILNAPSFMKGELKATGGSLLTSTGPQIMDAPNAFKGELRTLNRGEQVASVKLGERPQTNPTGDEYIDIELGSGKAVLKKRISEKWMTGEAL